MKVLFHEAYSSNLRRIEAPLKLELPKDRAKDFEILLSDVARQIKQAPDINEQISQAQQAILNDIEASPMAAFKFGAAELRTAVTPLFEQAGPVESLVNEAAPNVKKPTLLSARRLDTSAADAPFESEVRAESMKSEESPRASAKIENVREMVLDAGSKHGVDSALALAVMEVESGFDTKAISQDGHSSKGLFQLLDKTGKDFLERSGAADHYSPFDPKQNTDLGMSYLRYLHEVFSSPTELHSRLTTVAAANSSSLEKLAVAAFNAGEGRVASAQQRAMDAGKDAAECSQVERYLPESTRKYVQNVIARKQDFEATDAAEL